MQWEFFSLQIIVWEGDEASHRPDEQNCSAQPFCCPAREAQLLFSFDEWDSFETRSLGPQSITTTALIPLI